MCGNTAKQKYGTNIPGKFGLGRIGPEYCGIIIVLGTQCSWISWITLTHRFLSLHALKTNNDMFKLCTVTTQTTK